MELTMTGTHDRSVTFSDVTEENLIPSLTQMFNGTHLHTQPKVMEARAKQLLAGQTLTLTDHVANTTYRFKVTK